MPIEAVADHERSYCENPPPEGLVRLAQTQAPGPPPTGAPSSQSTPPPTREPEVCPLGSATQSSTMPLQSLSLPS